MSQVVNEMNASIVLISEPYFSKDTCFCDRAKLASISITVWDEKNQGAVE